MNAYVCQTKRTFCSPTYLVGSTWLYLDMFHDIFHARYVSRYVYTAPCRPKTLETVVFTLLLVGVNLYDFSLHSLLLCAVFLKQVPGLGED